MYISFDWLKEFVKIPSKITPWILAEELTGHTVEVEKVINSAAQFDKVVVGKVLEATKHPNADRLRVTVVDIGSTKLNIVCGAPNVSVGQLVAVATVGAILPNGLEIKSTEIRGEKSEGMICAEDELGLGDNHEGIMVLKNGAKIGEAFAKYLKAEGIVLEIDNKSLSNRPDLLNHYGIAREVAAIFDLAIKPYDNFFDKKFDFTGKTELDIKVKDNDFCLRYQALRIEGIEVKESPDWLKERIIAINQRPINNIVDLTNYVMFDCGQPMHAFDAAKVKKIVVRRATKGENIETLDEKVRSLSVDDLLITDGENPIAIAGVMGGKNSGIDDKTTSLILESANFSAVSVRRSSQRTGLRTEASVRFEKSLDPALTEAGMYRFLTLLKKICPKMKISSALTDINNTKAEELFVSLDFEWLFQKIGQEIAIPEVIRILKKLGFGIIKEDESQISVSVPSWRATKDVSNKEDLAEEVLRLFGYDKIVSRLPVLEMSLPEVNKERILERKIKNILSLKYCLNEVYNYSFVGEEQLNKLGIDFSNHLRLANPLNDIQTMLRQSLVPGLISNIKTNQGQAEELRFFEIGSTFWPAAGNFKKDNEGDEKLPYQEKNLGIVLADNGSDVFGNLKSIVDDLIKNIFGYKIEPEFSLLENIPGWADKKTVARISVLEKEIGRIALVDKSVVNNINLKRETAIVEINFTFLIQLVSGQKTACFKEFSKYPAAVRDLAFVVDEEILYNDIRNEILKFNSLIKSVELFDVYVGDRLPSGQKSLAFRITCQDDSRTLTMAEMAEIQDGLAIILAEKFDAKLRSF